MLMFTLVANVALSVWSIRFLESELSTPLRSMESVMQRLYEIKRAGESEIDLLYKAINSPNANSLTFQETTQRITETEAHTSQMLDELEALPSTMLRSGITTIQNLRSRANRIEQINTRWAKSGSPDDGMLLIRIIDTRHELIERVEGRILDDTQLATSFGQGLKSRIYSILLVTLVGALAIGLLMVIFIRRWVISPIEHLRAGAERMAMGDFGHPIHVHSNDELGQLSDEFNRMGVLIQEMQARQIEQERLSAMGEMAQRTVHNFRTPLAGIRALSETTMSELEPGTELHDFQSRIISTVDRFEVWLKEMLRTSAPLELSITQLDPVQLVRSVVDAHQAAAESKNQSIELIYNPATINAKGDAHHLEHAMTSVLSNAIEFAPEGSTIQVEIQESTDNPEHYWTLRISNMGAMIPPDLHRSIFRPYFTTRPSGTGIGLAMTKRVVDQHAGQIGVESPLDAQNETGCAFTIRIPMNPE